MTPSLRKIRALMTSSYTNHDKSVCISSHVIKSVFFSSNVDIEYTKYPNKEDTKKW
jgi:hypothetical protein